MHGFDEPRSLATLGDPKSRTSTEVRSPTSTSTEVRSPTSTSTDAYTQGNVTVTGGAGTGATSVTIYGMPPTQLRRADEDAHSIRAHGAADRMQHMVHETMGPTSSPTRTTGSQPMSTFAKVAIAGAGVLAFALFMLFRKSDPVVVQQIQP